jgi:sphingolipid delta-4 desaturase
MRAQEIAQNFTSTGRADPHIQRRRDLLRTYPQIRKLFGNNPWSAVLIIVLATLQLSLAACLRHALLWQIVLSAALVGAYLAASLFAMIHDASHGLIFRNRAGNYGAACLANMPLVMWTAVPFFRYHLWHHRSLGDFERDVGVPTVEEARWVGNSTFRKAAWLAFFSIFQALRTRKFPITKPYWNASMRLNATIQVIVNAAILGLMGWQALLYLGLSIFFSLGFHPLGTRVVQEHFVFVEGQETNNFTGWANLFECNFGYHTEHHDFPNIPWNRLPRLQRIAPEFYRHQAGFGSRLRLMWQFIFDPAWSVYRNTVRLRPASQPSVPDPFPAHE